MCVEAALAVVGQDHDVAVGAAALSNSASLSASTSREGGVSKSMRSSCCCRPITRSFTVVASAASRCRLASHALLPRRSRSSARAGLVAADHREQRDRARPSAAQLRATLAAPPGRSSFLVDPHDRHRRFGRDAVDVAEPVAVEHHVADDEDARVGACRGAFAFIAPIGDDIRSPRPRDVRRLVEVAAVEDHRRLQAAP